MRKLIIRRAKFSPVRRTAIAPRIHAAFYYLEHETTKQTRPCSVSAKANTRLRLNIAPWPAT